MQTTEESSEDAVRAALVTSLVAPSQQIQALRVALEFVKTAAHHVFPHGDSGDGDASGDGDESASKKLKVDVQHLGPPGCPASLKVSRVDLQRLRETADYLQVLEGTYTAIFALREIVNKANLVRHGTDEADKLRLEYRLLKGRSAGKVGEDFNFGTFDDFLLPPIEDKDLPPPPPPPPPLPAQAAVSNWKEHTTNEGVKYFYNSVTEKSSWEIPSGAAVS